jgi:2-hydroxy-3-oxopropionate reductase
MKIGFIGLGAMGHPMVRRLLAGGVQVGLWARRPESLAGLAGLEAAEIFATPAELAAACPLTFSIVTRDADVASILLGEQGLLAGMSGDSLHIDMSTIAPDSARRFAAALAVRGARFLDAPVSGGPRGAEAGTLAIMVGGRQADLARAMPLLALLGQRIVHIGPQGAGQVAKACNQMVMVASIQAVAEALALAAAAGLDLDRVRTAIAGGSGASRVIDVFGPRMVDGDYTQGVESRLHHKDFAIVLEAAQKMNLALPLAATVGQRLSALQARGGAHDDTASLFQLFQQGVDG